MNGVKKEKCYYYGGSPIFRGGWGRGGGYKKTIYWGNCLKRGDWTICKGSEKNREKGVFWGGIDTLMHSILVHAGTWDWTCWCEHIEFPAV